MLPNENMQLNENIRSLIIKIREKINNTCKLKLDSKFDNNISNLHRGYFLFFIVRNHLGDLKYFFLQAFDPYQGISL